MFSGFTPSPFLKSEVTFAQASIGALSIADEPKKSVLNELGYINVKLMPKSFTYICSASLNPSTEYFVALYNPIVGNELIQIKVES